MGLDKDLFDRLQIWRMVRNMGLEKDLFDRLQNMENGSAAFYPTALPIEDDRKPIYGNVLIITVAWVLNYLTGHIN